MEDCNLSLFNYWICISCCTYYSVDNNYKFLYPSFGIWRNRFLFVFLFGIFDFSRSICKKKYFVEFIDLEEKPIKLKIYKWSKLIIDKSFDANKMEITASIKRKRYNTIVLVVQIDGKEYPIFENALWTSNKLRQIIVKLEQLNLVHKTPDYINVYG